MKARVTLADIARRAGVHVTTVSLALHDHPSLPLSTRQRLKGLAEEMGYRRDPELQALMAYRRSLNPKREAPPLAYITNWDSRWGWREFPAHEHFYAGAVRKAESLGYKIEHFWLSEPNMTSHRLSDILFTRGITGLILASQLPANKLAIEFDWSKFATVKIDYFPNELRVHNVTNDQRTMIQLAVRKILDSGYRRIGLVMPRWWDDFVGRAWSAGFLAEQQDFEPDERLPILYFGKDRAKDLTDPDDWRVPREEFEHWLRDFGPEVLLSYAPFVLDRIAELGISIPDDLAFADLYLTEENGAMAGLRHNSDRVGETAVELLVGQLHRYNFGLPEIPISTLVEGTWCEGRSMPNRTIVPSKLDIGYARSA